MKILSNHLYEYRKGVRQMFMMTLNSHDIDVITRRLDILNIAYYLHTVSSRKINVFFGRAVWIETVRNVVTGPLNRLSAEQDFILGTLLGYDREVQCRRYLQMSALELQAGAHDIGAEKRC